jgi:hypothetical protein
MEKAGDNIVNLGSKDLNINTTTAKGLEKAIAVIAQFILKAQNSTNKILYGDPAKQTNDKVSNKGDVQSALNKGVLNVLETVASVDLCNIINYAIQQIPGGTPFDPTQPPPTDKPVERAKWKLQKAAYDTQTFIDEYYNQYTDSNNLQSRIGLADLITQVRISLDEITQAVSQESSNPVLLKSYPELSVLNNFIDNAVGYFNKYTDVNSIPNEDVQKIISYIDKTRNVCIAIQGINSPASLINFADSTFNAGLQEQIERVQKIINPARLIPLLNSILKTANNINNVGRKILGYINTARAIIRIAVLLLKVFKIIVKFLKKLPIPSMYIVVGIQNTITEVQESKLKGFIDKTIKRLNQINFVLSLVVIFVDSLLIAIDQIIQYLKIMLLNLEGCKNISDDLIKDLNDTIDNLTGTRNDLQSFVNNYNNNANQVNKRFGKYTIEIMTEELVDEGISLKRRYGVGISPENTVVVQSTPTFASLDQIIINEVKVLLVSGGFVDSDLEGLSNDEILILTESLNYLEDGDINIQEIETSVSESDFGDTANLLNTELELGQFLNNLPGGKALRRKVRKAMQKGSSELKTDLQGSDPGGRYSESIIKSTNDLAGKEENSNNKAKIEELEKEKEGINKRLIDLLTPRIRTTLIDRLTAINKEIDQLKNS